ncbi:MAG: bifunctional diaminohydroxyphosphoribosylaminopyrimidine deaminase/5-amino-6-(5-phosphoribosylamino)uracil reductase RibD [Vibrio sp.]
MKTVFMRRALHVSQFALPECQPNPPVGCVLVKNNQIIAEGWTQAVGGEHAEVQALRNYAGTMEGVTAFVTLEPCAFVGRTPACAKTLVESGIEHVVVAILDPDPRNSGQGIALLRSAGVHVDIGVCSGEVRAFISPYLGRS